MESLGHRVLLIEDNNDDALLMTRAFEKAGVQGAIRVACDGREAVEYLKQCSNAPELILLDLQMPKMHGLKVLEWIRCQPQLRSTVVVVLSSSRLPGDIQLAYKLGVNSYLLKPSGLEALYQTVSAIALYWLSLNQWPKLQEAGIRPPLEPAERLRAAA